MHPTSCKILLTNCHDDIKRLQNTVSIKPNESYSVLILSGTAEKVKLIEDELNELLRNVHSCVVKKMFILPCHYLPLLKK